MREKYEKAKAVLDAGRTVTHAPRSLRWISDTKLQYEIFEEDGDGVRLQSFRYDAQTKKKEKTESLLKKNVCSISPDGTYEVLAENWNLYLKDRRTGKTEQLTFDGEENNAYGMQPGTGEPIGQKMRGSKPCAGVMWSKDSVRFLTYRIDERKVKPLYVVQNVTENPEDPRPILHSFRYALPGDEYVPQAELYVCDVAQRKMIRVQDDPLPINYDAPLSTDVRKVAWCRDNRTFYYTAMDRYFQEARFMMGDALTGKTRQITKETRDTFFFYDSYGVSDGTEDYNFTNYVFADKPYAIWQSDKSGYMQLYLYDYEKQEELHPITQGAFEVISILGVDEETEQILFTARGLEGYQDPYYEVLCRVFCDGSGFEILTPEDCFHRVSLSPNRAYFADVMSEVDRPPVCKVRRTDTGEEEILERADISRLLKTGFILPEKFSYTAEDGTARYGVMITPPGLKEKAPVIDYIYGGVQDCNVPKEFVWHQDGREVYGGLQSLAQLGFIGIILDASGTPKRGKAFHERCYRRLDRATSIEEHVQALEILRENHPLMDLDRVGIWGSSGGGYAVFRAMCEYPGVYKVGVSAAGCHNMRCYCSSWVERYNGAYDRSVYEQEDNRLLAARLQGKLLIVHGDIDDNVNISNTMGVVRALVEHNKDFEMLIVPNELHSVAYTRYLIRRRWDHFVKYLLEETPPAEFPI